MTSFKQFQNITINFWINLNFSGKDYQISYSPGVFSIEYRTDNDGYLFKVTDSNSNIFTLRSGVPTTENQWKMITMVYDQASLESYIDSKSTGSIPCNNNSLYNGDQGIKWGGIDGRIQEYRVYDSALTYNEVRQLYKVVDDEGLLISSKKTI